MTKIWIDLTDISMWSGHFTGIQRVVYNLAQKFYEGEVVEYFRYDEHRHTFYKANFRDIIENLNKPAEISVNKKKFKQAAIRIYMRIPIKVRMAVPRSIKTRTRSSLAKSYKIGRRLTNISFNKVDEPNLEKADFRKDDLVLVFGNNWDRPTFINDLKVLKSQNEFQLYQFIYDLIPTLGPHLFGQELFKIYTKYIFETVAVSDGLFCISRSTEKDLLFFCQETGLPRPRTKVVRLGDSLETVKISNKIPGFKHKDFVICVGTIEVRKNHTLLYYAWKEALRKGHSMPPLIIVGKEGWHTKDIKHILSHDPELINQITIYENLGDAELKWLYENCLFSIYPSMYEGWGLPIAESLAYGKLCVASNSSSMTEIAGNLIDYFSPYNSGECADLVNKYYENRALLADREKDILKEYKSTPWSYTYQQVKEFLNI